MAMLPTSQVLLDILTLLSGETELLSRFTLVLQQERQLLMLPPKESADRLIRLIDTKNELLGELEERRVVRERLCAHWGVMLGNAVELLPAFETEFLLQTESALTDDSTEISSATPNNTTPTVESNEQPPETMLVEQQAAQQKSAFHERCQLLYELDQAWQTLLTTLDQTKTANLTNGILIEELGNNNSVLQNLLVTTNPSAIYGRNGQRQQPSFGRVLGKV